jgi:hypothetical protein
VSGRVLFSVPPPFGVGGASPELRTDASISAGWTSSLVVVNVDVDAFGESAHTSCITGRCFGGEQKAATRAEDATVCDWGGEA